MIPLTDLSRQYKMLEAEITWAIRSTLESGQYVKGNECDKFEKDFAEFCGANYAVGVGNGTDALYMTLEMLGVKGKEVITSAFTFTGTCEAIYWAGAKIVLVDIEPDGYTIDTAKIKRKINDKTAAIIPVHLYGNVANMYELCDIANKHDVLIIEDAAQAHGARLSNGKRIGSIGNATCFSLYPSKILGAYGDAGVVTTNSLGIAEGLRKFGTHGFSSKYNSDFIGVNSRLDNLQAAVLNVKMRYISYWLMKRRYIAKRYNEELKGYVKKVMIPPLWSDSSYYMYVIEVADRDKFIERMGKKGIGVGVHYPEPIHRQPQYKRFFKGQKFPVAERVAKRVVSLPCYPEMKDDEIDQVIRAVRGK